MYVCIYVHIGMMICIIATLSSSVQEVCKMLSQCKAEYSTTPPNVKWIQPLNYNERTLAMTQGQVQVFLAKGKGGIFLSD